MPAQKNYSIAYECYDKHIRPIHVHTQKCLSVLKIRTIRQLPHGTVLMNYKGILLCFLGGLVSFFVCKLLKALITLKRVLRGSITSSI
jgi:hypothetical protein